MSSYHEGHRALQDRFDTRRIADRLEQVTYRSALSEADRQFVASADMFFLATADTVGNPDCSYKGGDPGFVRVSSDTEHLSELPALHSFHATHRSLTVRPTRRRA
jgi:predicted pyridoxine 5'-phosphate oxidase superfamily flavin-nucleotide-binding protein